VGQQDDPDSAVVAAPVFVLGQQAQVAAYWAQAELAVRQPPDALPRVRQTERDESAPRRWVELVVRAREWPPAQKRLREPEDEWVRPVAVVLQRLPALLGDQRLTWSPARQGAPVHWLVLKSREPWLSRSGALRSAR